MSYTKTSQYKLENAAEIDRMTDDLQNKIIKKAQKILKEDVTSGHDLPTEDTGSLGNSAVKDISQTGFKTVEFTSPYAIPVEFGMPSGIRVNIDELTRWVQRKLKVADDNEAVAVATKIRYKILKNGIQPTRFLKKAIKLVIGEVGTLTPTVPRQKKSGFNKSLSKMTKMARMLNKYTNKSKRNIKKFKKFRSKLT